MPRGITHRFVSAVPDNNAATAMQPQRDWNDLHAIFSLNFGAMTTPTDLQDGDVWPEANGVSPNRTLSIKIRDLGVTRTIVSITF